MAPPTRRDLARALRVSGERVLVTGAAGLLGSHLGARFLRDGLLVRALDRNQFDLPGAECLVGDVADAVSGAGWTPIGGGREC